MQNRKRPFQVKVVKSAFANYAFFEILVTLTHAPTHAPNATVEPSPDSRQYRGFMFVRGALRSYKGGFDIQIRQKLY